MAPKAKAKAKAKGTAKAGAFAKSAAKRAAKGRAAAKAKASSEESPKKAGTLDELLENDPIEDISSEDHSSEESDDDGPRVARKPAAASSATRDRLKTHQWLQAKKHGKVPAEYVRAFDKSSRADQTTIVNNLFKKNSKGEYEMNLQNSEVVNIVSRMETDRAEMGLGGCIREVAEGQMPGSTPEEQSRRLDAAVRAGRVFVEVTDAGIELYNFPQASRAKGVTNTTQVMGQSTTAVDANTFRATTRSLASSGISLSALTPSGSTSMSQISAGGANDSAEDSDWDWWSQSHVTLEKCVRDGNKFYDKAVTEPSTPAADAALEKLVDLITAAEEHQMQSSKVLRSKKDPVSGAAMTNARLKETSHSIA